MNLMNKNFTLHFSAALLLIVLSLILPWTSKSNASDKNSSTGNRSSADNFTGICEVTGTIATIPEVTAQSIVTSLWEPVHVTNASDGSGRLFIVEKRGTVQILLNGMIQSNTYLDISNRVKNSGEMDLLSMAFHPEYSTNGKSYVNYVSDRSVSNQCTQSNRCTIISEFTENKTIKLEDSERILMEIDQPYSNHNGGQIAFGLEDNPYLYIGMGDGGYGDDPEDNSQDLTNLLGAILRIDVNHFDPGLQYSIPLDNPNWTDSSGTRREIWSYGFRNPWRFSFDPLDGALYAGDVGQGRVEEIDVIKKWLNYGWRVVEGDICNPKFGSTCKIRDYEAPIITHTHSGDGWYSITGGAVYRGSQIPDLCGVYLYGDYVKTTIRGLRYDKASSIISEQKSLTSVSELSTFGYDENYEVYVTSLSGTLYKIVEDPKWFRHASFINSKTY